MAEVKKIFVIRGIQSWDFNDPNGKRIAGSKLFCEHVPAKNGTVGSSYEEFKLLPNIKQTLIEAYGGENNLLGVEIEEFTYDKYGRINGFKFN